MHFVAMLAFYRPIPENVVQTDRGSYSDLGVATVDTVTNKELLLERFAEHPELLGELAAIFLEDGATRMAAIRAGVSRRDAGAVQAAAHALRGSVANFEATRAVDAALKLELMGEGGDLTGVEEAFADLQLVMEKLNIELGGFVGESPE
jgi:HPt (histidine-containing phosphotransfer) domain-containing protein